MDPIQTNEGIIKKAEEIRMKALEKYKTERIAFLSMKKDAIKKNFLDKTRDIDKEIQEVIKCDIIPSEEGESVREYFKI